LSKDGIEALASFQPKGSGLKFLATHATKAKILKLEHQFRDHLRFELSQGFPAQDEVLNKYELVLVDLEGVIQEEKPL